MVFSRPHKTVSLHKIPCFKEAHGHHSPQGLNSVTLGRYFYLHKTNKTL